MKEFLDQIRRYGLRVSLGNYLVVFTARFIGANRMTITYKKHGTK